jgi:hypothetical protein
VLGFVSHSHGVTLRVTGREPASPLTQPR